MALADWMISQINKPSNQAAVEYPAPIGNEAVRMFYLTHIDNAQNLQEVATLVRAIGDIRRLFIYNTQKAVALRAPAPQIALAQWLFDQFNSLERQNSPLEYKLADGPENLVRVFYLTHADTPQRLQEIAVQVRTTTSVRRLFTYNAPKAMALR